MILKPDDVIKARLKVEDKGEVHKMFTKLCYVAMDKYVPLNEGRLRSNVQVDEDSITYQTSYAKYQFYGKRQDGSHKVRHYTTPGTGPHWDKRMKSVEMKNIEKNLQEYIGG